MTTRDAHVRSPRLSPVSFAVDAPLRSVGFPTFRLTPPQFSRPFAIPSLRSLQIFSPRPERRGLNSSATLSYEIIAHSFRRSAYMPDRNNANPPQSNSFRRFAQSKLANMYTIAYVPPARNHPKIFFSEVQAVLHLCSKNSSVPNPVCIIPVRHSAARKCEPFIRSSFFRSASKLSLFHSFPLAGLSAKF